MTIAKELLEDIDLGAIVAEQDKMLAQCFIEHPVLREIISDKKDIVLGAKGAGKSALWKEFKGNQGSYKELSNVLIAVTTNPSGDPEFRDVLAAIGKSDTQPDEDELRVGWRLYFLSQFWRNAKTIIPDSIEKQAIAEDMVRFGIDTKTDSGMKVAFAYAMAKARALKKISLEWTKGISVDFDPALLVAGDSAAAIPFNALFQRINDCLEKTGNRIWLVLDRLDEIVLSNEHLENLVLKGLLLAFRDISDYPYARVKIFLRDDVYSRVTENGHFPALTHVRSRAAGPIKWDHEDLLHLLVRRIVENKGLLEYLCVEKEAVNDAKERAEIYYAIFPRKVDKGRAAEGIKWVVDRITDGNDVATPRDLLSVFEAAKTFQLEVLRKNPSHKGDSLIQEDALRRAVRKIAKDNLETRIFAEYPDLRPVLERFRNGKADHNLETLEKTMGIISEDLLKRLQRIGFLYRRNRKGVEMWTIPFFFSYALEATRGAAFDIPPGVKLDEEDD